MATFEVTATFRVFAHAWVKADTEQEARSKIDKGGGYIDQMEFEKHTAELDGQIESIVDQDAEFDKEVEEIEDES